MKGNDTRTRFVGIWNHGHGSKEERTIIFGFKKRIGLRQVLPSFGKMEMEFF